MNGSLPDGMYAMGTDDGLSTRMLGGPFHDIDDVLDSCFENLMRRGLVTDRDHGGMFYVEVRGGVPSVKQFPKGAFPMEHEMKEVLVDPSEPFAWPI